MAIVRELEQLTLSKDSKHTEVDCTYSVIQQEDGTYFQVDTYGAKDRQEKGKKSQSIRFSPEAIRQLKELIQKL